jgi:NADH dehydrogenase
MAGAMKDISSPAVVTVFGGSGFVGRYVVRALAKRGYFVRVAVRRPDLAGFLQPLGNVGQIVAVQANLRNRASVDRAVAGSDHVVNCVGILFEKGRNTFDSVQDFGTRAVAEACRAAGVRLTHVSAIGADTASHSAYARTKGMAEEAIRTLLPQASIIRPSILFGPEDQFFNRFADMARFSPFLPLLGGGGTLLQPVYVGDVAEAIARDVDGTIQTGRTWELGGAEVLSFRECMTYMLETIHRRKAFISVPWPLARLMGSIAAAVPLVDPVLTRDQVILLQNDNIVSEDAVREGRTLEGMGLAAATLEAIIPGYLVRFRPAGQFERDIVA